MYVVLQIVQNIKQFLEKIKRSLLKKIAIIRIKLWRINRRLGEWFFGMGVFTYVILSSVIMATGVNFSSDIQQFIEKQYIKPDSIERYFNIFSTLGGALAGASLLMFSLILFAIQVNVEKLPHKIFKHVGFDHKLIYAFLISFVLATIVIILSALPDNKFMALIGIFGLYATSMIIICFIWSYKRMLYLISPTDQLDAIISDAHKYGKKWQKYAENFMLLANHFKPSNKTPNGIDPIRQKFLVHNEYWSDELQNTVDNVAAIAKRLAESNDHQISLKALLSIYEINEAYIKVKGKTFYNSYPLSENNLVTDAFITHSLESLRQISRQAINNGDENLLKNCFETFKSLAIAYINIDYGDEYSCKKHHAALASDYLIATMMKVIPHNMPDILMDGIGYLEEIAIDALEKNAIQNMANIIGNIAEIYSTSAMKIEYSNLIETGITSISKFQMHRIFHDDGDKRCDFNSLNSNIKLLTQKALSIEELAFVKTHRYQLAPYYSENNSESFINFLSRITNEILLGEYENDEALNIVKNIESWAVDIDKDSREILLLSIENKSSLVFDILYLIKTVVECLLDLTNAKNLDIDTQKNLESMALSLVSVYLKIPTDETAIIYTYRENIDCLSINLRSNKKNLNKTEYSKRISKIIENFIKNCTTNRKSF